MGKPSGIISRLDQTYISIEASAGPWGNYPARILRGERGDCAGEGTVFGGGEGGVTSKHRARPLRAHTRRFYPALDSKAEYSACLTQTGRKLTFDWDVSPWLDVHNAVLNSSLWVPPCLPVCKSWIKMPLLGRGSGWRLGRVSATHVLLFPPRTRQKP